MGKYEESLERAKSKLPEYKEVVEYIFPELKENEDEKIRKELLNYLYDVHDDDEERARWIAWLKKQGEKNQLLVLYAVGRLKSRVNGSLLIGLNQSLRLGIRYT